MIELTKVTKEYKTGKTRFKALSNISIDIKSGEFVSILGKSGSGKSSLMHVIGGLDKEVSGRVKVFDRVLTELTDRELARFRNKSVGFVFQFFNLVGTLSALDNVMLPLIYDRYREGRRKLAERALDRVGLTKKYRNRPSELSGGEQQRVAIARALVNDPEMILADEPTGNLDSKTGREIFKVLKQLNAAGKTLLVVTHDSTIAKQGDRMIEMLDGRIVKQVK